MEESKYKVVNRKKPEPEETAEITPSQSDIFRSIGEKLDIGFRKGDISLDAITYYVQGTANLDDFDVE